MTDYDVGDLRVPTLLVEPFDGSTAATLTVVNPFDGSTTNPTPTTSDGGHNWTAPGYEIVVAGEWIERWAVTGTGAGKQRFVLQVAPDPATVPTGARVYATTTDYANHLLAAPPAGARRALIAASRRIDELLLTAVYDVDTNGLPTDADVIKALRDATCLQAEYAKLIGTAAAAGAPPLASASIGSASISRQQPATGQTSPYSAAAYARLRELPPDKLVWGVAH